MAGGRRSSGEIVRLAEYQVDRPTVDYPGEGGGSEPDSMLRGMPTRIGRYTVLDLLGVGGMGVVCTAWDPKLDRKVALKLLRRKGNDNDNRLTTSQARLVREAKSLARLSHPNIITVHDVDTYEGQIYMAMEYVDGTSLDQWVIRGERPWREVVRVFIDAAKGLAAAHEAGIIHRDFKPANVLLGKDARVMVVDFGLAKSNEHDSEPIDDDAAPPEPEPEPEPARRLREQGSVLEDVLGTTQDTKLTQAGRTVGTPAYMAPEQFLGLSVGPQTDQFSFGVALFEALYGYLPFPDDSRDELIDRVTEGKVNDPPKDTVVPGWVHRVVLRALQPRPENRHASMDALIAALQADPAKRRRRVLMAGGGVVLLGLGTYGVVQGLTPDHDLCSGAQDRMAEIWSEGRKGEIERAFAATERAFARDAWERVEIELDERARQWAETHTDVCEATNVRGEQSAELMDVRIACLDRHHGEMRALVDVFAEADDTVVEEAVNAVQSLGDLSGCRTMAVSQGLTIDDPERRAKADEVEDLLAQAKAMKDTGDLELALAHAERALEKARELDHRPLLARAALVHAQRRVDQSTDAEEVRKHIVEAIELATETEQPGLEAEAWSLLIVLDGEALGRFEAALALRLPARMAVERANDKRVEGAFASAVGTVLSRSGRHEEALEAMMRALKSYEAGFGKPHPKVAGAQSNVGTQYGELGLGQEARHYFGEAAKQMEEIYGPNHPLVGRIHFNIGLLALRNGEPTLANQACKRAVEILGRSMPPGHPRTLAAMVVLARAEHANGDTDAAERRYVEVVSIVRAKDESERYFLAVTLTELAQLQRSYANQVALEGDSSVADAKRRDAAKNFGRALTLFDALEDTVGRAKTELDLCLLEIDRKSAQSAIEHCQTAWDLERSQDVVGTVGIEAVQELAVQQLSLGNHSAAIRVLREGVDEIAEEHSTPVRIALADLLWAQPEAREDAVALVRQVQTSLSSTRAPDDVRTVERWLRQHPLP